MAIRRPLSLRGVVCRGNLIIFSLFLLSSSLFITPAFATATVTAVTSVASSNQGILPNSPRTALLRVQVTFASGDTVTGIEAAVINYSETVSGEISELAIYSDSNNNGVFDSGDSMIAYKTTPNPGTIYGGANLWTWSSISEGHYGAPSNIWYYFIVVRTSGLIDHADAFYGWLGAVNGGPPGGGTSGTFYGSTSNVVRVECKVVDIYYTESYNYLLSANLVAENYETYWKPNYLSYAIAQEMTEPNETDPAGTHLYDLSQARRYSYLTGTENLLNEKAAYSNFLKFERRRKLMGMNVPTPVLGIKVSGKNQYQSNTAPYYDNDYFDTMGINFTDTHSPDTANFDPATMLFDIMPNFPELSGVAVYQDTNNTGVFEEGDDTVLKIESSNWSDWSGDQKTLTLRFRLPDYPNPGAKIPQVFNADTSGNEHNTTGVDFFVVLRARPLNAEDPNKINYGADFTAQVTGMSFTGYDGAAGAMPPNNYATWYATKEIKAVFELSDYTGTRVDPNSTFPIIGINVNDGGLFEKLNSFNLYLQKTDASGAPTNFDPAVDLVSSSVTVGVTVLDRNGSTVPLDIPDPSGWVEDNVTYLPEVWYKTKVSFSPTAVIPDNDIDGNAGSDYFINLTTSSSFGYGKQVVAMIPDNEFIFGTNLPSADGTALTTNANVDYGSNERVYPNINPLAPVHNPIRGNPAVSFSQINTSIKANSGPTAIIGIDLASNTTADIQPVLKSIVVQIVDTTTGGFAPSDLLAMNTDSAVSGIGLYNSTGSIELAFPPSPDFSNLTEDYRRYLLVLKDPLAVPQSLDGTPELYVTLNTSSTISSTDAVILRIWGSEIKPCSSYGLGFRATDDSVTDTEKHVDYSAYGAVIVDHDTLMLTSALGGLVADYNENWYLVIAVGGDNAIGRIYKVTGVSDPETASPDVTVEGIDLTTIGTVTAVKFFKVDSTSYKNFSTPVESSGTYSLNITQPDIADELETETLTGPQYKIEYDADAVALTPLALYRVQDPGYTDTTLIVSTVLSSPGLGTCDWDTKLVPTGTYRIYGELGPFGDIATDYSDGTVKITNSPPITLGPLTITPSMINIGDSAAIALYGLSDDDSNDLTVTFYSTDAAGADTRIAGISNVSAPYPNPVTLSWNTTGVPAGNRLLYAEISDIVNNPVVFPIPPNGTPFIMQVFAAPTGSAISQVISGQGILPNSPKTAILGLNLTSTTGDPLNNVRVTFTSVDDFSASDLAEVALYRDSGGGGNEFFDSSDVLLGSVLAPDTPGGSTYTIPGSGSLPINDTGGNTGIDYFIVVRTSNTIDHYDAFYAADTRVNGAWIDGVYTVSSGTIRCECKVVDVFYTQSFHFDGLTPPLVLDPWNRYWVPNYLSYSIRTEMTEPNQDDPVGDPYPWYLTDTGNYRYSYTTGGPFTTAEYIDFTHAYSNRLKFERKRQLLQMQVPTAILGIKVAGKNQFQSKGSRYDYDYLNALVIDFTDTDSSNFNAKNMLFPLNVSNETQSGVALYRDNNYNGILDEGDQPVPLFGNIGVAQWTTDNQVTFNFGAELSDLSRIPQTYNAESELLVDNSWNITYSHDRTGTDFLVVIRARPQTTLDSKIKYGADFTAKVTTLTFVAFSPAVPARDPLDGPRTRNDGRGFDDWNTTREVKAVLELSDLTGSRVDPNSTFPLIGINVVDGPGYYEKIYTITLQLKDEVGFDPNIDISDVLVYRGATIQPGITKSVWVLVVTPTGSWWQTIISAAPGLDVPDTDNGLYQGDDYYVVLQTSENFGYLDKITGRILDGGIVFSGTTTSALGTGLTTNALLPPVSNTRVHWDPFASPKTPLPGNVAVKFHDLIITPFLEAGSDPAAILGLELSSNTVSDTQPVLKSLVVQLINTTTGKNYFDMNDLAVMTTNSNTSGLGVWKDLNDNGVFDTSIDEALTMAAPPTQYVGIGTENYQRFIIVLDEAQSVGTSFSPSGYPDYFVTIKARDSSASDQLLMRLWGSEMKPPASYGLGFRATTILSDDNVTDTEAFTYFVTAQTTTPTSTLTLDRSLGGSQSGYNQNWYLVITGTADTAKGAVIKILGYVSATKTITCEDLSGLGSISQVRVFKLDSTSYQNHSVGVAFKIESSVTLFASSTTSTIVLTWEDDTPGGGTRTFDIERRVKDPVSGWTLIESNLPSFSSKLTVDGNIYKYTDVPPEIITYEYRVTVKQSGVAPVLSNIASAKLSSYFPYRPTNLGYSVGFGEVEISWDWQDGYKINEDGFIIERKGKNETDASWIEIGSSNEHPLDNFGNFIDRSITDLMLETESTYHYRVRAFKGMGIWTVYSDYSDPIEVEVLPSSVIPGGGGCFIATAAFGTPMAKEVVVLRKFRDRFLLTRPLGKAFVRFYYRHSPAAAEFIRPRPIYCSIVRGILRPLVWLVKAIS